MRTSRHARERIVERDEEVSSRTTARKIAKLAFRSGATINQFQKYPAFFTYLSKMRKESNTCRIRVYRGNIYIWKGNSSTLITCHPIPEKFIVEMEIVDRKEGR